MNDPSSFLAFFLRVYNMGFALQAFVTRAPMILDEMLGDYEGPATVGTAQQQRRAGKTPHTDGVSSVSYTHLDVYKRQYSRCVTTH